MGYPFRTPFFLVCLVLLCFFQKLTAQNACSDWLVNISAVPKFDIIQTLPDTSVCNNASFKMRTQPVQAFCWTPTDYLDDPTSANPTVSPQNSIVYYFIAKETGVNLAANGDFSLGNTGFTSDYISGDIVPEGTYTVDYSPAAYWANAPDCKDHTTGAGKMMLVNGAGVSNVTVWSKTINISPNTLYEFSCWIENISRTTANLFSLQFSINDIVIGPVFHSEANSCIWRQFFANWNSGNLTTAKITILNQSTAVEGNDFAIDDILFAPVLYKKDSVKVTVNNGCTVPITLKDFVVEKRGKTASLSFEIFHENELATIEIERSKDGVNFSKLTRVEVKPGGKYDYTDWGIDSKTTVLYYRIRMISKLGEAKYSEIKFAAFAKAQIVTYPLSSILIKNQDFLLYSNENQSLVEVAIFDPSGRMLVSRKLALNAGINKIPITSNEFAPGVYFMTLNGIGWKNSYKLVAE